MKQLLISLTLVVLLVPSSVFSQKISQESTVKSKKLEWFLLADSLQKITYQLFLSVDKKYFIENNEGKPTFNYWWNAHALDVLVDGFLRTGNELYKSKMKDLMIGIKETNKGSYFNDFYDDMGWLALASLRAYEVTKDEEYKNIADALWKDIQTGINDQQGGGLAWRKSQLFYKNTPANGPAIILACRLYKLDKNENDLAIAKSLYSWLKKTLVEPSGFVLDGKNREKDGKIDQWKFTYNQGLYIGAGLELFRLTKDKVYLDDAVKSADYLFKDKNLLPNGILKSEGHGDGGLFKGVLVRYLTLLIEEKALPQDKRKKYLNLLNFNANTLKQIGLKEPEMLAGTIWNKKPEGKTDFSTQLSAIMLIEAAWKLSN